MARYKANVRASETGQMAGDGKGSRPFGQSMPTKGGRNATTNEARRGAGQVAPRPQVSKQPLIGSTKHTAPVRHGLARVPGAGSSGMGSFTPPQNNAMANLHSQSIGQHNPQVSAAASNKPRRKGLGSAFFGEYPNG